MRNQRILSLLALSLTLATGAACGKKKTDTTTPGEGSGTSSANNPAQASVEAKAAFAKVAKSYASASAGGTLSGAQCEKLAKAFTGVYSKHGTQMTIAWFNAGAVWEECGKTDEAEQVYKKIIAKEPTFDLAYNNLGAIYWNRKQESKALDYFKRAVKANTKTKAPRNNLAAALRNKYSVNPEQDSFAKAERNLQTVLAVDSANQLAYENLARLYYDRGRLKDKSYLLLADLVVTQATRMFKEAGVESPDIYNIKGLLFMERENQVDALRAFQKAAELNQNHADAHMNIAMISIRFRDYQQAEKSLTIALKDRRQKKNIETYLGLGVAQRGLRKYKEAEASFKEASKINGKDARPLYNLGILYQEHVAGASEGDGVKEQEKAKDYFGKFISKAGGAKSLAINVTDAKQRVKNIDQYFIDLKEMKALQAKAEEMAKIQAKQEAEERQRLLDLEKKAKAAAAAAAGGK